MQRVMNITSVYPHLEMVRAFHLYEGQLHLVRQKHRAVLQQCRISNVCGREHVGAEQPKCWTVTNLSLRSKTTLFVLLCVALVHMHFFQAKRPRFVGVELKSLAGREKNAPRWLLKREEPFQCNFSKLERATSRGAQL